MDFLDLDELDEFDSDLLKLSSQRPKPRSFDWKLIPLGVLVLIALVCSIVSVTRSKELPVWRKIPSFFYIQPEDKINVTSEMLAKGDLIKEIQDRAIASGFYSFTFTSEEDVAQKRYVFASRKVGGVQYHTGNESYTLFMR